MKTTTVHERVSPQVQHPETVHRGNGEHQGHYPGMKTKINMHIRTPAPSDDLLSEYLGQHKPAEEEELDASWEDKRLHCLDQSQTQEVSDISWKRLDWKTAQERQRLRSTTPKVEGDEDPWETPVSDATAETYILVFIK